MMHSLLLPPLFCVCFMIGPCFVVLVTFRVFISMVKREVVSLHKLPFYVI